MKQLIIGKKAILNAIVNKTLVHATISNKDSLFFQKVKFFVPNVKINNDKKYYDKITNNHPNHQFAIGYVNDENITNNFDKTIEKITKKNDGVIVILDRIYDPRNFGAIIRTCECFGVDGIIYKKHQQCPITSTVNKTSAGAVGNINLIKVINLNVIITKLKEKGFWIYCSCLEKSALKCHRIKFDKKIALIIGNEENGVSQLLKKNSDFKIWIETTGKTQSLNVANATAILLYAIKTSKNN